MINAFRGSLGLEVSAPVPSALKASLANIVRHGNFAGLQKKISDIDSFEDAETFLRDLSHEDAQSQQQRARAKLSSFTLPDHIGEYKVAFKLFLDNYPDVSLGEAFNHYMDDLTSAEISEAVYISVAQIKSGLMENINALSRDEPAQWNSLFEPLRTANLIKTDLEKWREKRGRRSQSLNVIHAEKKGAAGAQSSSEAPKSKSNVTFCKFFHGPGTCTKGDDCIYLHDDQHRGWKRAEELRKAKAAGTSPKDPQKRKADATPSTSSKADSAKKGKGAAAAGGP